MNSPLFRLIWCLHRIWDWPPGKFPDGENAPRPCFFATRQNTVRHSVAPLPAGQGSGRKEGATSFLRVRCVSATGWHAAVKEQQAQYVHPRGRRAPCPAGASSAAPGFPPQLLAPRHPSPKRHSPQAPNFDLPNSKLRNSRTAKHTQNRTPSELRISNVPQSPVCPAQSAVSPSPQNRRLYAPSPHSERTAAPKPSTRGAWAREHVAEGTGCRHCRPAGGKPLLVGLPPSTPTTAPSEPNRSTQALYSWGLGA